MEKKEIRGRGSDHNPPNPFLKNRFDDDIIEGIDEPWQKQQIQTQIIEEFPKQILSKNDSPDLPFTYSINPYQGCEHGCVYCYARSTHNYWGLGMGLDFESKIIVKRNAADLLEKSFLKKTWKPQSIMLSGNTDCYQPIEKNLQITRSILKVFEQYQNPVGIITKNSLILRDLDVLKELSESRLVKVFITITTMDENIRRRLEPRASSFHKRLKVIEELSRRNIPVGVMIGPVIPGLTEHEMDTIMKNAANSGALDASYTVLRLNGDLGQMFERWAEKNFPDRSDKILNKVREVHNGNLHDNKWLRRLRGEGKIADIIAKMYEVSKGKYYTNRQFPETNFNAFRKLGNLNLF